MLTISKKIVYLIVKYILNMKRGRNKTLAIALESECLEPQTKVDNSISHTVNQ